jgi:hypothetical protein
MILGALGDSIGSYVSSWLAWTITMLDHGTHYLNNYHHNCLKKLEVPFGFWIIYSYSSSFYPCNC